MYSSHHSHRCSRVPKQSSTDQQPPQRFARRQSQEDEREQKCTAILIILLTTFLTGLVAGMLEYQATPVLLAGLREKQENSLLVMYGSYSISVIYLLFYPVFGFLADVCLGRYLAVTISIILMALGILLTAVVVPVFEAVGNNTAITLMSAFSYIIGVVGMAGFEANVVQFGLDQLMDSSSRVLSLYLHCLVWIRQIGVALTIIPLTLLDCDGKTAPEAFKFGGAFRFMPLAVFTILGVTSTLFLIRKRACFSRELGNINPYKMVLKVISFALKNRHPQQRRSAFYYYYGLNPGRLDFAKAPYGGPYSTEDVENVKTLLQMLGMLLCVGPVFILKVSTSYFMYQHFVQHFVEKSVIRNNCHAFWPLLGSGNLENILAVLLYPIYVFVIFKVLKSIPKILLRLLIGIVMVTLCQLCLLLTEITGHYMGMSNANTTLQCALTFQNNDSSLDNNSLNIHWISLLPPNLLLGLATPIVITTVFEFISAQSPRPMTGLVFGTFFFIKGLFQLFGTLILVPFSIDAVWKHHETKSTPTTDNFGSPDINFNFKYEVSNSTGTNYKFASVACEMWYLVAVIACGLVGIVMYSVAVCKYRYRKREENPFPQSDIEDIVTREIEEDRDTQNLLDVASVEVRGAERRKRGALHSAST